MSKSFAFFSVKGGVGKSALAVAAAVAFAGADRPVAVVDIDLSGTSLADGLRLRAPDGLGGQLSLAETVQRRLVQEDRGEGPGLPYIDRRIHGRGPKAFDPAAYAWRHDDWPAIRWYPSSPAPRDVTAGVRAMATSPTFDKRLHGVLSAVLDDLGPSGVLLVDAPPSFHGISPVAARFPEITPVLVTTDDRNDLYRSAEEYPRLKARYPTTRWILNRNSRPPEDVRADLRAHLSSRDDGVELALRELGFDQDLARLFRSDGPVLSAALTKRVQQLLEGS